MIQTQASTLNSVHIEFNGKKMSALDMENNSISQFSLTVDSDKNIEPIAIDYTNIALLIEDDYTVEISSPTITFRAKKLPLVYIVLAISK
jgi:hypothetical protein